MSSVVELRPTQGRLPPLDLDAEGAVIATILLKASEFDVVIGIVQFHMFYSDANKFIFETFEELVRDNIPIDVISVASRLKQNGKLERAGGSPYLADLTDKSPAVGNVITHAEIVKDKWQARQLILRAQRYVAEAYAGESPSVEIVQRAATDIDELLSVGTGTELVHIGTTLGEAIELRARLRADGQTGTGTGSPTGYRKLDQMSGGLQDTDLVIVAGRPGMGKTTFAMNLAANLTRPVGNDNEPAEGVAMFSLEMPRDQIAIRFACAEATDGVNVASARMNSLTDDAWERLGNAARSLSRHPIWIDDTPVVTLLDVRARVKRLMRDIASGRSVVPCSRLKLVIIDYLQLMKGLREKGDSREAEVASLSRGLKALAKNLKVTVIAVSQLNRNPEKGRQKDRRPELSDLRESGAIEQDADRVWFLYREKYYDRESDTDDAELIVAKDRNGPTGIVPLRFQDDSVRFFERAEDRYDDLTNDFVEEP